MNRRYRIFAILGAVLLISCGENSVKRGYQSLQLGDYDMAIGFFNEQLHRNPRDFQARVGMGKALLQKSYANGQDTVLWRQALVQLQAARSIGNHDFLNFLLKDAWITYGRKKLSAADTLSALIALTFALDYDPSNSEALNLSAVLFSSFGLTQKAESLLTVASYYHKTDKDILFNLGILSFHRKEYSEALRIWKSEALFDSSDAELRQWIELAEKKNSGKQVP
jgi:tetratricopeptide (TPR) repeat protein